MRSLLSLLSSYRMSHIIAVIILFVNEALVKNYYYYCSNKNNDIILVVVPYTVEAVMIKNKELSFS